MSNFTRVESRILGGVAFRVESGILGGAAFRVEPRLLRGVALAATLLVPQASWGFCRATDCLSDPANVCSWDEQGCIFEGIPLGWELGVRVRVEVDATDLPTEYRSELAESVGRAVESWAAVRCPPEDGGMGGAAGSGPEAGGADPGGATFGGAGNPSSTGGAPDARLAPRIYLDLVQRGGNILVVPRSQAWPHGATVVAKTTLDYDLETGSLSSATLELNYENYRLEHPRKHPDAFDLDAVLAHELGHVLGLDHSTVEGATMESEASSEYSAALASLAYDDKLGLCALYPPVVEEDEVQEIDLSGDVVPANKGGGCALYAAPRGQLGWLTPPIVLALWRARTLSRARRGRRTSLQVVPPTRLPSGTTVEG